MDFGKAISSTGDLLFEFAASLILIPRTLVKIVIKPSWAVDYLSSSQSPENAKNKFEKYSHPILFWIVIGIMPYCLLINSYFVGYTDGKVLQAYYTIGITNIVLSISVFLISFPISCSFILQLFKHKGFTKTTFKKNFFIQLYITAPLQLFYIVSFFVDEVSNEWLSIFMTLLFLSSILWFLIAEVLIIKKELHYNYFLCLCVLLLMYLVFFVFAAICCFIFFMLNLSSFQKLGEAYFGDMDSLSKPDN
jgi:hypothetical protein